MSRNFRVKFSLTESQEVVRWHTWLFEGNISSQNYCFQLCSQWLWLRLELFLDPLSRIWTTVSVYLNSGNPRVSLLQGCNGSGSVEWCGWGWGLDDHALGFGTGCWSCPKDWILVSGLNTLGVFLEQPIWFAFNRNWSHSWSWRLRSKAWFSGGRQESHLKSVLLIPAKH